MPETPLDLAENFSYEIKTSRRARNLRLTIGRDGTVIVTKPIFISERLVGTFIQKYEEWIKAKLREFAKRPAPILGRRSIREYKANKEAARRLVHARIAQLNAHYGYAFASIRIGNQKSRWGSCSAKANLNFNYKIIFLPKELQDYVIVHELCHLKEMNHSERFWKLVAEQVPNWKRLRKELRKY